MEMLIVSDTLEPKQVDTLLKTVDTACQQFFDMYKAVSESEKPSLTEQFDLDCRCIELGQLGGVIGKAIALTKSTEANPDYILLQETRLMVALAKIDGAIAKYEGKPGGLQKFLDFYLV